MVLTILKMAVQNQYWLTLFISNFQGEDPGITRPTFASSRIAVCHIDHHLNQLQSQQNKTRKLLIKSLKIVLPTLFTIIPCSAFDNNNSSFKANYFLGVGIGCVFHTRVLYQIVGCGLPQSLCWITGASAVYP